MQKSVQLPLAVLCTALVGTLCTARLSFSHEGHAHAAHRHGVAAQQSSEAESPQTDRKNRVSLAGPDVQAFQPFSETVSAHVSGQFLVVESNGLPSHNMMVGIRSWQQQVPLPQPFVGENAWRLPGNPQFASKPISVLKEPLRGAIALAVNGVPIFCALNNRGDDAYLAGELDEWGGHCGRGDDYHYHIAPVHLEDIVGVGNPIGYALDGYPILGLVEADGSVPSDLDEFNGHKDSDGHYHYHATQTFPYINGGLRGVVKMNGDQIEQPQDAPVRAGQEPLRGATITGFSRTDNQFDVQYEVANQEAHVKYSILDDDKFEFTYIKPSGETSTVVYRRGGNRISRSYGAREFAIFMFLFCFVATAVLIRRYRRHSESE